VNPRPQETKIIICPATDRTQMDQINATLASDGFAPWAPSIEHSITQCQSCGQDVWIGPNQKQIADSVLFATIVRCVQCQALDRGDRRALGVNADMSFVSTNLDADALPRRY
jgi:hypothetical protein